MNSGEDVLLARLIFFYGDELPGLEGSYIFCLKPQKIAGPKTVIDPHGKKEQLLWRPGTNLLSRGNVFGSPDGIHPDGAPFLRMVGVFIPLRLGYAPAKGVLLNIFWENAWPGPSFP